MSQETGLISVDPTAGQRLFVCVGVIILAAAMLGWLFFLNRPATRLPGMLGAASPTAGTGEKLGGDVLNFPEIVERRDAFSRHFDLGKGRFVAYVNPTPLNFQDQEGNWQPIEPKILPVPAGRGEGWEVSQNSLRSRFAPDHSAIRIELGEHNFYWQPEAIVIDGLPSAWAVPTPGAEVVGTAAGRSSGCGHTRRRGSRRGPRSRPSARRR